VHAETLGSGPRVVLVHGSVANGRATWGSVLAPLAERFQLVVLDRPGFPPHPEPEAVDFEEHARLVAGVLEPPAHLVGHSYGGVIALLAAGLRPEAVRSLAVLEPPALGVARGQPAVEEFVAQSSALWASGPRGPEAFLRAFLGTVGSSLPSQRLSPGLLQGARTLMLERPPWEAEIPLRALRGAPFPKLVASGAHHEAFEVVCDVLARRLRAERAVLPGAGHSIPRAPGCAELLAGFLGRAEAGPG
jgi:pimeloyl-ACP methyl ester carboxylesterase